MIIKKDCVDNVYVLEKKIRIGSKFLSLSFLFATYQFNGPKLGIWLL